MHTHFRREAFTLIELLVVIAIIAILAVVVVLVLNPAQLLAQSRDANRVSDLATINSALSIYQTDQGTAGMGTSSIVYASVPDAASSTCGDLGLPSAGPDAWNCGTASQYRSTNGAGWIPVNFAGISSGAPFGSLPVDPVNQTSSALYYTYETAGTRYELTAEMESAKYKNGGSDDVESADGGQYANLYEKGTSLALAPVDFGGATLSGYGYRRAITIDHTKVPNTDLADFPVLFSGTYSYLATAANGGNVQNANGYDIIFTSDYAGSNILPFQQESYNAATGAVSYWIQVPTVSHAADTVFYMWYGNANVSSSQASASGVWSNGYVAVYHFSGASLNLTNSVSSNDNLTDSGATLATGEIGGGISFNGGQYAYNNSPSGLPTGSAARTYSAWFKLNASNANQALGGWGNNSGNGNRWDIWWGTNSIGIEGENVGMGVTMPYDTNWHFLVSTNPSGNSVFSGTSLYLDGVQVAQGGSGSINTTGDHIDLGTIPGAPNNNNFNGSLDEVRISNVVRSADWVSAEYHNESSPSTFYSVGAAVTP